MGHRTFTDVPWILQKNWTTIVQEALLSVLTTPWNFGDNIEAEQLDGYVEVGDFFMHEHDDE